ncbi:hypothetical protein A2419_02280 [Candidatus Adlerbacteria bacterium RIFOXYC1_FULL_48_26]|uniref:Uncharacterized protein n=1 Tax=Candidatus Adlerbacteria bacterium RIFOXYC1_FULL_48_26 TaxID=1797247 RepID=A0A1F4Y1Y6_9BACT|nr:MAG: hypothetical protein A2419_02280 [Candidatus Adlerbacteria bacterium RIFOXYC1_FULL_48_26]OGC93917.1 MAG: hypothetical protein A2389_02345 [Candidatus Adlerbacteria bacterium RIFOXYB1_FULL_48_10]OGC95887.1 MAG: hypothetical protein A2590_01325 [Candidatus Adlerbacteria bacterium RIFOXYD1_FULL_48_8]
MANPQLTAYIRENLTKFSKEAVIQSLSTAGWSAIDISAAFMELEHPAPPAPAPAPAPTPVAPAVTEPTVVPAPAIPPASSIAIEIPAAAPVVAPTISTPPVQAKSPIQTAAPQDSNSAFLAEMTKRRKEAEAMHPQNQTIEQGGVSISVGGYTPSQSTVTQGGLVGMVMKTGLVKTEQQANVVLIGIIIVCLGTAAWFIL